MRPIPATLDDFVGPELARNTEEFVPEFFRQVGERQTAPRELSLVISFVLEHIPAGKSIYIYGANGEQTRMIVDAVEERNEIKIAGFVDRRATPNKIFLGREVIGVDELKNREFDYVLLSHVHWEHQMHDAVRAAGIPEDKIIPIYSNPDFIDFALDRTVKWILDTLPSGIEYCLLTSTDGQRDIVPESALATVFPPEKTVKLLYGRNSWFWNPESPYRSVNTRFSVPVTMAVLRKINPKAIYVRSTPHVEGQYLSVIARKACPDAAIIHESNDWAVLFEDDRLRAFGFDDKAIGWARFGELYSVKHADCMLAKIGGQSWMDLTKHFGAKYVMYFPMLPVTNDLLPPYKEANTGPVRVAFAGSYHREDLFKIHPDLNYTPLFEKMVEQGDVMLDIFNANHVDHCDYYYRDYLEKYQAGKSNIIYHRFVPPKLLAETLAPFDYGWLYNNHANPEWWMPVSGVSIGSKMGGYIWAGVPILVDHMFEYMAELVTEFDAGVVVPAEEGMRIREHLVAADRVRHREGARRMREHMVELNRSVMATIQEIIERKHALVHGA